MSRILFVVPPFTGHINPTVATGAALLARGHSVAWAGPGHRVRPLLAEGATLYGAPDGIPANVAELAQDQGERVRGLASLKYLWEQVMLPLAHAMLPGVEAAVDHFQPNVLVVDQQALAGMLVARRRGLRWATSATTSAGITDPLELLPKVKEWKEALLAELLNQAGLPALAEADLSPHLVLITSTPALAGPGPWPPTYCFTGPTFGARPAGPPFPWEQLGPRPRVFVSLGTVSAKRGARLYAAVAQGLAPAVGQVILVAPPELVPDPPANLLVLPRVPQLALLPHVDAVVCHGGHNTVAESLAAGLPLVVCPIRDDQPVVAQQVVEAGCGLRLHFGRITGKGLAQAVTTVLGEEHYREAAVRVGASFHAAGGAEAAADALLALAAP